MCRLTRPVRQLLEIWLHAIGPVDRGGRHRPELPELHAEPISTSHRVLGDDAAPPERRKQSMGGGLFQIERPADVADAELRTEAGERLEDVDHAVDDLRTGERSIGAVTDAEVEDRVDVGQLS